MDTSFDVRLARLEAENRRIKRWLACALVVLAAMPLVSFTTRSDDTDASYRIVYASKFALKDPRTGILRAQLAHSVDPGGWAGITLWDDSGHPRSELKLWEDGRTLLSMTDPKGKEAVRLAVSSDGEPKLALGGKEVRAQ